MPFNQVVIGLIGFDFIWSISMGSLFFQYDTTIWAHESF